MSTSTSSSPSSSGFDVRIDTASARTGSSTRGGSSTHSSICRSIVVGIVRIQIGVTVVIVVVVVVVVVLIIFVFVFACFRFASFAVAVIIGTFYTYARAVLTRFLALF